MPLQPRVTGDDVVDQWSEEVTYELNNVIAQAALIGAQTGTLMTGQVICPVYATDAEGTDQSLRLGSRQFVYFYTKNEGEEVPLPLADVTFVQFRGEDARSVEIVVKLIPTEYVNSRMQTRDYNDFALLVQDWSVGAVEPEDFADDPDGMDFGYRTQTKMLMARVRQNSSYADPVLARSFDYTWNRNGQVFTPSITGVLTGFPFIFLNANDVIDADPMDPGISSQFFCNIVQL